MGGTQLLVDYAVKFLSAFITLGLIAKMLGPASFSNLILVINSALWVTLVFSLGLDRALLTSRLSRESVLHLTIFFTIVKVCVLLALALLATPYSVNFQFAAILAIGLSYEYFDFYFRRDYRFRVGAYSRLAASIVALILRLAILALNVNDLNIILFTYIFEYFCAFFLLLRAIYKEYMLTTKLFYRMPEWSEVRKCLNVGVPVMGSGSAMFLINYWPSLVGGLLFNLKDVGVFIMAQKICDTTIMAQNAYHQSMAPKVVALSDQIVNRNLEQLQRIILTGFFVGLLSVALVYFLSFIYVRYILGMEYFEVLSVVPLLLVGQFISIWSGARTNILLGLRQASVDLQIILVSLVAVVIFFLLFEDLLSRSFSPIMIMAITVVFGKSIVAFVVPLLFPFGRVVVRAQLMCLKFKLK